MRLALNLAEDIAMIADCVYMHRETDPTVQIAIYREGVDAGESDGRLNDEGVFADLHVRNFELRNTTSISKWSHNQISGVVSPS